MQQGRGGQAEWSSWRGKAEGGIKAICNYLDLITVIYASLGENRQTGL